MAVLLLFPMTGFFLQSRAVRLLEEGSRQRDEHSAETPEQGSVSQAAPSSVLLRSSRTQLGRARSLPTPGGSWLRSRGTGLAVRRPGHSEIVLPVPSSPIPLHPCHGSLWVEYPACPIGYGLGHVICFGQWEVDMPGRKLKGRLQAPLWPTALLLLSTRREELALGVLGC